MNQRNRKTKAQLEAELAAAQALLTNRSPEATIPGSSLAGARAQPNTTDGFTLRPGDGWIFMRAANDGVFVWQGHLALTDTYSVQVQAQLDTNAENPHWVMKLREFDVWTEIAEFTLPMLGAQSYVEGEVKFPLAKPKHVDGVGTITHRKLKVRMFKGNTRDGETVLRLRLPQIERPSARTGAGGSIPL